MHKRAPADLIRNNGQLKIYEIKKIIIHLTKGERRKVDKRREQHTFI